MDDRAYERRLDRKARRFGMAVAVLGLTMLTYSIMDPTLVGMGTGGKLIVHLIDGVVATAFIVEGVRRVLLGRATRPDEEGLFALRAPE